MSIVYIGMDVHKDFFILCAYIPEFDTFLEETKCAAEPKNVEKFIDNLREHLEDDADFLLAMKQAYWDTLHTIR